MLNPLSSAADSELGKTLDHNAEKFIIEETVAPQVEEDTHR